MSQAFPLPDATQPRGRPSGSLSLDWRRALLQGTVVGVLPLIVDIPLLSTFSLLGSIEALRFVVLMVVIGVARGVVWACTAQWGEGRLSSLTLFAVFLTETVILTLMSFALLSRYGGPWNAGLLMLLWLNLAYGGAFFVYCVLSQRALRVQSQLARATLARERSAAQLQEERINAISMRLDPGLLQSALAAIEHAYESDRQRADSLLDALVAFLRLAMPSVRSGRSMLREEMALLSAYESLQALIYPARDRCNIETGQQPADISFPPLLLIPLVESARAAGHKVLRLSLRETASAITLVFDSESSLPWLDADGLERVSRQLDRFCGSVDSVNASDPSGSLTLRFPKNINPKGGSCGRTPIS